LQHRAAAVVVAGPRAEEELLPVARQARARAAGRVLELLGELQRRQQARRPVGLEQQRPLAETSAPFQGKMFL
jgi:hypothetical protein